MSIKTHIMNWIEKANPQNQDYYILFIKAWIPYNAWYMNDFYDEDNHRTNDRSIIGYIKNNSNKYRDRIIALLGGNQGASQEFFIHLSKLYYELEHHPIPDYENRISFSTMCIDDNTNKSFSHSIGKYTYISKFDNTQPRTSKRWICEVLKKSNNQTIHRIELFKWSIKDLRDDSNFKNIIEDDIKMGILHAFNEINPKKPVDVIVPPKRVNGGKYSKPNASIVIDENKKLYFKDDRELVSKVLIELIYELRCKLFHGEIDPTESNQSIYEEAYHIQKILIQEFK